MTTKKNKVDLKRVNMNLPSYLVDRVVDYANSMGLNTTSAYIVLLNQALDQKATITNLPMMAEMLEVVKTELAKAPKIEDKKN